jgi:hypothetical protein
MPWPDELEGVGSVFENMFLRWESVQGAWMGVLRRIVRILRSRLLAARTVSPTSFKVRITKELGKEKISIYPFHAMVSAMNGVSNSAL